MSHVKCIIFAVLILSGTSYSTTMSFEGLGVLPGGSVISQAWGISADGTTVVGRSTSANGTEAFRWTPSGGLQGLGDLTGNVFSSTAYTVNADASVIAGTGFTLDEEAFIWTATNGMQGLGLNSTALGLSADGGTLAGSSWFAGNDYNAMRWTATNGQDNIYFGDVQSQATAVTADGTVFVGWIQNVESTGAYLWTESGGRVLLGDLAGGSYFSRAHGISADGSVVIGQGQSANGVEAMRWTQAREMVGLGVLPGGTFQSTASRSGSR
jgi:probable HAF family extracellular repeat protein